MYNVLFLLPFVAQGLEMMNLLVSVNTQHIDLQTLMLLKLHRPASTWNKLLLISFYLLVKHFFASKTLLYDGILASTSIIAYIWLLRLCALFHVLFELTLHLYIAYCTFNYRTERSVVMFDVYYTKIIAMGFSRIREVSSLFSCAGWQIVPMA